jgi:hypothetical protein
MHGLFVREVLKRQRDSIRGLNGQAIPLIRCGQVRQEMLQNPERRPPPDNLIQINNIKFNMLYS